MQHADYMKRCVALALQSAGYVAPNPMVGAVLVYNDRIIGEGFHQQYGQAHAEVNCIASVKEEDRPLIAKSVMYVSLEPCAHFGKTPPCADLIIRHNIPKVVIGCPDPFIEVAGRGIEKLKAAGVDVELGILEKECRELNKRFFTFHTQYRPYVILKWAQTGDGFIAPLNPSGIASGKPMANEGGGTLEDSANTRLFISNEYTNRLVHQWRSEEASILVGTNTALMDNPELTTRLWPGNSPIRLVIDMELKLPLSLKLFNDNNATIVFNTVKHTLDINDRTPYSLGKGGMEPLYYQVTHDVSLVQQVLHALYQLKIQSVLVEGGARLLQSFIDEDAWEEARIITNSTLEIKTGLPAPQLTSVIKTGEQKLLSDKIEIYKPLKTSIAEA